VKVLEVRSSWHGHLNDHKLPLEPARVRGAKAWATDSIGERRLDFFDVCQEERRVVFGGSQNQ